MSAHNAIINRLNTKIHRVDLSPLVIAHRGASRSAPENSCTAFELAIDHGADMIELDVRRTKDDELIVTHEWMFNNTLVDYVSYQDVIESRPIHLAPPRFSEVCDTFGPRIPFNVELKAAGSEQEMLDIIRPRMSYDQYIVSSFNAESLYRIREIDSQVRTALLVGCYISRARNLRPKDIMPWKTLHTIGADVVIAMEWLARMWLMNGQAPHRLHSIDLWIWGANGERALQRLAGDHRVDGLVTDTPEFARYLVQEAALGRRVPVRTLWGER